MIYVDNDDLGLSTDFFYLQLGMEIHILDEEGFQEDVYDESNKGTTVELEGIGKQA